jgi:hypothetical protein
VVVEEQVQQEGVGMRTNQPVNDHKNLLGVVDGLLEEMGIDRHDTGGKVTFAGLDPLRDISWVPAGVPACLERS